MINKKYKSYVDFYKYQINSILENPNVFINLENLFQYSAHNIEIFEKELLTDTDSKLILGFNATDKIITINQFHSNTISFTILPGNKKKKINKLFASLIKGEVELTDKKQELIALFKKDFNKIYQKLYQMELQPDFSTDLLLDNQHKYFKESFSVIKWIRVYQMIKNNTDYQFYTLFKQHIINIDRLNLVIDHLNQKELIKFYNLFLNAFTVKDQFLTACQNKIKNAILDVIESCLVQKDYETMAYLLYPRYDFRSAKALDKTLIDSIQIILSKHHLSFALKISLAQPVEHYPIYVDDLNKFPDNFIYYFPLINQELTIYVKENDYQQLIKQIKSYQLLNKISSTLDIKIHQLKNNNYIVDADANAYILFKNI